MIENIDAVYVSPENIAELNQLYTKENTQFMADPSGIPLESWLVTVKVITTDPFDNRMLEHNWCYNVTNTVFWQKFQVDVMIGNRATKIFRKE